MNLRRKPCPEEVCLFLCVPQIGCIVSKREVLYEIHHAPVGDADLLGVVVLGTHDDVGVMSVDLGVNGSVFMRGVVGVHWRGLPRPHFHIIDCVEIPNQSRSKNARHTVRFPNYCSLCNTVHVPHTPFSIGIRHVPMTVAVLNRRPPESGILFRRKV